MTQPLAEFVAARIRAEMGLRMLSAAELGRRMGVDETWVRRRTRGQYAINMSDLERFARALDVPVGRFIPEEVAA